MKEENENLHEVLKESQKQAALSARRIDESEVKIVELQEIIRVLEENQSQTNRDVAKKDEKIKVMRDQMEEWMQDHKGYLDDDMGMKNSDSASRGRHAEELKDMESKILLLEETNGRLQEKISRHAVHKSILKRNKHEDFFHPTAF